MTSMITDLFFDVIDSANNHPTTTTTTTTAPPRKPPNIIYSTRTHSQMDQCIKELRRSPYRPVMTALASR